MKLIYTGSHSAVEVVDTGHIAQREGDPIDVPDDVGNRLLEQAENWKQADAPAPAAPANPVADDKGGK